MAASICIKCGSNRFESTDPVDTNNAAFKVVFVQCADCGGVVGVQDAQCTPHMILKLAEALGIPESKILAP